jgi:hypothetical protein
LILPFAAAAVCASLDYSFQVGPSVPIAHDEDALYLRRSYSERQRPAVFLQVL